MRRVKKKRAQKRKKNIAAFPVVVRKKINE